MTKISMADIRKHFSEDIKQLNPELMAHLGIDLPEPSAADQTVVEQFALKELNRSIQRADGRIVYCVADVSGKGIAASLLMSNFQASLRTLLRQTPNMTEIVEALNYQVMENTKGEKFITFFGAIYDVKLRSMVYVNAGHNPPILVDKKNGIRLLEDGSTVLGAMHPLPFLNEGFLTNLDDFLLFCFTDGVTETVDESEQEFGMERLMEYFQNEETFTRDLRDIHQDIIVALDNFKGRNSYHDDITILSCRVGQ